MINYEFNSLSRNTSCAREKSSSPNSPTENENQVAFLKTTLMKWLLCSTDISKDMAVLEATSICKLRCFCSKNALHRSI